ncbi:hypothetical protein ACM40_05775 [Chryseobacterium sp. BLS98]|uniref:hypothetical protein n=1 Tax=Chryseobacterium sp. BLS98 TaxID=885586 RepID=UPI00065ADBBD|nr:hypothetical protein [Chryseobacterium sp. BLS98]KMQ61837.1 hypothetical protein ACM40_05775 [Chryseobacterium sp. BLS98]
MDINTIVTAAGTLVTVILTSLAAPYILNFHLKRKFQKLQYMIDAYPLLQNLQTDFKDKFIEPAIQENIFFIISGFRTNYKSIPAYNELKDKLGNNFDWPIIKSAKAHLSFNELGKLHVNLTKTTIYFKKFSLCFAVLLALLGFAILVFCNYAELNMFSKYLVLYILAGMAFLLAYFVLGSITSILDAGIISKRLQNFENANNNNNNNNNM